ncbi:MAG TPA: indole-3-glycerol phosphate synthase TrpC [Gemmatimonadaceae bacterium]|nr:indole-3-glycerol phosphate synthase TrpC [Gemmatimonadaceae bacterium]
MLGQLVAEAMARVEALQPGAAELERKAESVTPGPRFQTALKGSNVGIIAEVKRASPSKGAINRNLHPGDQALAFERGGAAAISVLTEPTRFEGSNGDLEAVKAAVGIPVLKKDFHVDRLQLLEAKALGSSAALVIVRAIPPRQLAELLVIGREIDLEILVEVRDERELDLALSAGAEIIGVNNRDLETLVIDASTVDRILPLIPPSCWAIAESGFEARADIERAAASGADAILVGSLLSRSADPEATVRSLAGVTRVPDARQN